MWAGERGGKEQAARRRDHGRRRINATTALGIVLLLHPLFPLLTSPRSPLFILHSPALCAPPTPLEAHRKVLSSPLQRIHIVLTVQGLHCSASLRRLPDIRAMAVQTHRIHSIHGTFGPAFVVNSPLQSAQASSFNKLPNVSVTSHDRATNLAVSAKRSLEQRTRPRRVAPSPPLRQSRTVPSMSEDPFADQPIIELVSPPPRTVPSSPCPPPIASRTRIPPPVLARDSLPTHSAPEPQQVATVAPPPGIQPVMLLPEFGYKEARGKLVAYLLLNRHCGRPRRRRFGCMGGQSYIPSALSRMVTIDPCA